LSCLPACLPYEPLPTTGFKFQLVAHQAQYAQPMAGMSVS